MLRKNIFCTKRCLSISYDYVEEICGIPKENFFLKNAQKPVIIGTSVAEEKFTDMKIMLKDDTRMIHYEIKETLSLNAPATRSKYHLHVTEFSSFWMPYSQPEEQKTRLVKWCREIMKIFDKGQSQFVNTTRGDEIWLYNYDEPIKS